MALGVLAGSITSGSWLWSVETKQWIRPRAIPKCREFLPSPWAPLKAIGDTITALVYFAFVLGGILLALLLIVKLLKAMWYF